MFLYLRSLIDRGNWSLVLVGSEKLPDILRYQGERLNQVTRIPVDYLSQKENIGRLVRAPAAEYLEFGDDAIDKVHEYSAGNPYYATLIARRIYEEMVTKRDHFVGAADVDGIIQLLLQEESVSTFQHFWKDGIFEISENTEEFQLMNAQLLIACSELEGSSRIPVRRQELCAHAAVRTYDQYQLQYRIDNLLSRGVLSGDANSVVVRVPLVSAWMRAAATSPRN